MVGRAARPPIHAVGARITLQKNAVDKLLGRGQSIGEHGQREQ